MGTTCSSSIVEPQRRTPKRWRHDRALSGHQPFSGGGDVFQTQSQSDVSTQQQSDYTGDVFPGTESATPMEGLTTTPSPQCQVSPLTPGDDLMSSPPVIHHGPSHARTHHQDQQTRSSPYNDGDPLFDGDTSEYASGVDDACEVVQHLWHRVALANTKAVEDILFSHMFDAYREILGATPLRLWNLSAHVTKLIEVLDVAIGTLHNYAAVEPGLLQLGQKHAGYGVDPQSYGIFGAAMVQVFKTVLGEEFSSEQEAAWRVVFGRVTASMRRGAESPAGQRAAMNFKRISSR